jgi:hypothetical protein
MTGKQQTVWLALRMPATAQENLEVLGIFDAEADAKATAKTERDVIGPVPMNTVLPDAWWDGAYYPCWLEVEIEP